MKIDRLISILLIIIDKKKVTADELSKNFRVSIRTIQRDIDTLCSSGVPIYGEVGKNGGYCITENYKLDKSYISQNEINILVEILNGFKNTLFKDSVQDLLNKLSILSNKSTINNKLLIDSSIWGDSNTRDEKLEKIYNAVEENRSITFEYADIHKNISNRTVEPYTMIMKGNSWYLYAFCTMRDDYRLFNINRINNITIMDIFLERLDFKKVDVTNIGSQMEHTKIILKTKSSLYIPDYLNPINEKIDNKDNKIITCSLPINEWLYIVLLGMSSDYEVLEPECLRIEIINRINKSKENYKL